MKRKLIVEVSSLDAERYYEISEEQLPELIKLTPAEAGRYVRKNCKTARVSSSLDPDLGFADNIDQDFGGKPLPKEKWTEEWNDFCSSIRDIING